MPVNASAHSGDREGLTHCRRFNRTVTPATLREMAPKNRRRRNRAQRGNQVAGAVTFQYAFADNVDQYTTINITTASLGVPTDRPARVRWVRLEYSCSPDASPKSTTHVPLIQFEVCAPSGSDVPRILARTKPRLVPSGVVRHLYIRVPNAGFFVYDSASTIVLRMIVSASASLAVTGNIFCNVQFDFKSYQGLSSAPMCTITH